MTRAMTVAGTAGDALTGHGSPSEANHMTPSRICVRSPRLLHGTLLAASGMQPPLLRRPLAAAAACDSKHRPTASGPGSSRSCIETPRRRHCNAR